MRRLERRWCGCVTTWLLIGMSGHSIAADRIYRCEENGKVTYSDRGCTDTSESTEVQPGRLNSYSGERPTNSGTQRTAPSHAPRHASSRESIVAEQQRAKQRCERLADRLTDIATKLRRGYTVEQGERLKDQRRQIEQQRRTERC